MHCHAFIPHMQYRILHAPHPRQPNLSGLQPLRSHSHNQVSECKIVIYNVSIPVVHCMKELTEVEAATSENDSARLPRCYPDVSAKLLRAAKENWGRMSRNKQLEHV